MREHPIHGIPYGIRIGTAEFHLPASIYGSGVNAVTRKRVEQHFSEVIYAELHTRKGYGAGTAQTTDVRGRADLLFCQLLDSANKNSGWFDDSWIVRSSGPSGGTASHIRNGVQVTFSKGEVRGGQIGPPGSFVALRRSKALPYTSPGYYVTISDHGMPDSVDGRMCRLYLNVSPLGACKLFAAITAYGGGSGFKYQLKVLNKPEAYGRTDAGVLYLSPGDLDARAEDLKNIFRTAEPDFGDDVSAFCTPFVKGVGQATEELTPNSGRSSYGLAQSLQLAESVVMRHWSTICTRKEANTGPRTGSFNKARTS